MLAGLWPSLPRRYTQTGPKAHSASYPLAQEAVIPGVKRPDSKADHLPPSSTEVNNASTPSIRRDEVVYRHEATLPFQLLFLCGTKGVLWFGQVVNECGKFRVVLQTSVLVQ
jgi:hypothetical protein